MAENSLVICHFMVVCVSVCVCYLSSERTGCKKKQKGRRESQRFVVDVKLQTGCQEAVERKEFKMFNTVK